MKFSLLLLLAFHRKVSDSKRQATIWGLGLATKLCGTRIQKRQCLSNLE